MILHRSRFVLLAGVVAFMAFLFGFGTLLPGAQQAARTITASPPGTPRHSGDDGGFSVTLTEPSEPYLVGIKKIVIEPRLPPGDSVVGADFFVDGRLVATDRRPPYSTEIDFGQEIKRHTIIVTALTAGGRRAKVSFVSRAADITGGAAVPIALVPVVVRDAGGRFVDGLSVGDFVLLEDGTRQPIVHFDDTPVPQSIAVAIQAAAPEEMRGALLLGAVTLADSVQSFDSLGLVTVAAPLTAEVAARPVAPRPEKKRKDAPDATPTAPLPATEFSFDHALFAQRLSDLDGGADRPADVPLTEALQIATRGLLSRPRGRVLLLLLSGPGRREAEAALVQGPSQTPAAAAPATRSDDGNGATQELQEALDAIRRSGTILHVVVFGGTESSPFPLIKKAAEESGGEFLVAASAEAVDAACLRISESLRHQYLVSFAPLSLEREGWRSIELRLRPPGLAVQARKVYFASQPPKRP